MASWERCVMLFPRVRFRWTCLSVLLATTEDLIKSVGRVILCRLISVSSKGEWVVRIRSVLSSLGDSALEQRWLRTVRKLRIAILDELCWDIDWSVFWEHIPNVRLRIHKSIIWLHCLWVFTNVCLRRHASCRGRQMFVRASRKLRLLEGPWNRLGWHDTLLLKEVYLAVKTYEPVVQCTCLRKVWAKSVVANTDNQCYSCERAYIIHLKDARCSVDYFGWWSFVRYGWFTAT